jgi:hypothetical protein
VVYWGPVRKATAAANRKVRTAAFRPQLTSPILRHSTRGAVAPSGASSCSGPCDFCAATRQGPSSTRILVRPHRFREAALPALLVVPTFGRSLRSRPDRPGDPPPASRPHRWVDHLARQAATCGSCLWTPARADTDAKSILDANQDQSSTPIESAGDTHGGPIRRRGLLEGAGCRCRGAGRSSIRTHGDCDG